MPEVIPDRSLELFPMELTSDTKIIHTLTKVLSRNRGMPRNSRRFESDLQYNSYPDIFPKKLSGLLYESLLCLTELENSENHEINFCSFHSYDTSTRKCNVDLVGSLISIRYRINWTLEVMPYLFPAGISSKFQAIELFCFGKLGEALNKVFCELPDDFPLVITIPDYKNNKNLFKDFITTWIKKLEDLNL